MSGHGAIEVPHEGWRRSPLAEREMARKNGCFDAIAFVVGDQALSFVVSSCSHGIIGSVSVNGKMARLSDDEAFNAWLYASMVQPS